MVYGNTSKFVEGFEPITIDSKVLATLLNSTSKSAGTDTNTSITNNSTNATNASLRPNMLVNSNMNSNKPANMPTMMSSSSNMNMNSNKPANMAANIPTMMSPNMSANMRSPSSNSLKKNNKSSFKNTETFKAKKYTEDDESDNESDDESDNFTNKYDEEEEEELEEGFKGSSFIEYNFLKNILLSLLITFIAYILILSAINNLIPITTYTPHLKQFKHLIYGFIFFAITFMCLEVF